ncbi:MAG: single-stranded-DNA-specific exonuclease RecJ [Chitinophagales bacterium]|nr:single-stranded-DNA-specific exonuclease RecJ [Chitinophagales bacterium]MDW8428410.1 single-stranded-DNA-specific exonuclease RecJ [Chitinophagales bacterium]
MRRRWKIIDTNPEAVAHLTDLLQRQHKKKVDEIIVRLLVQRGIQSPEDAHRFFYPSLDQLHDPFSMADMDKAIMRLLEAKAQQQNLMVLGDYDVDGTTAVAMVYRFLKDQGFRCTFYIPNRYTEGYGVSRKAIEYAQRNQVRLIITLDCGIKSHKLIAEAAQAGIDFIVCDHHLPDATLPPACAILDPKRRDCPYPYKELSGCGIGFKLISALAKKLGRPYEVVNEFLDLVAVSIAADIVPVTGENRVLAHFGLRKINRQPNPGLAALIQVSGLTKEITFNDLVFILGPRINAAGRMSDATHAVNLLLAEAPNLEEQAVQLNIFNEERRKHDTEITQQALSMLLEDPAENARKTTVVYDPHWHKGVVGIVASRLQDHFFRPTIVITESNGLLCGSARSVPGFDLYEALHACRDLLVEYGGHTFAAGLKLMPDKLEAFKRRFEEVVAATITEEQLIPELLISAEIHFAHLTSTFSRRLKFFAPHGPDNLRPVFITTGVSDTGYSRIVKDNHLKVVLRKDAVTVSGIGYDMAHHLSRIQDGKPFDVCFVVQENEHNGEKRVEIKIKDLS